MSEPVYQFKAGTRLSNCDPQQIGAELDRVRSESGDGFSPAAVVEVARDESSALHPAVFNCDPVEAAERYWENQAAYVIRHVVVVYEDGDHNRRQTNAFVSITERETQEVRYLPVWTAMADEDYRAQIVGQALDAVLQWRHKYAEYKEFARVFAAVDSTAKRIRAA